MQKQKLHPKLFLTFIQKLHLLQQQFELCATTFWINNRKMADFHDDWSHTKNALKLTDLQKNKKKLITITRNTKCNIEIISISYWCLFIFGFSSNHSSLYFVFICIFHKFQENVKETEEKEFNLHSFRMILLLFWLFFSSYLIWCWLYPSFVFHFWLKLTHWK